MLGTSGLLFEASYDKPGTYLVQVCPLALFCSDSVLFAQLGRVGPLPITASKKHHHIANDHPERNAL
jgi:hypothetical protein